jgi:hypothetical protein
MRTEEAVAILSEHWAGCTDAFGLVIALKKMGAISVKDPALGSDLEAALEALEEAAKRLEGFSTNPMYHKAMIKGAKLIREMKHEWEVRAVSALRQSGESALRRDIRPSNGAHQKSL